MTDVNPSPTPASNTPDVSEVPFEELETTTTTDAENASEEVTEPTA